MQALESVSMNQEQSLQNLIRILQLAYSGERAAALAYRGHWHSVQNEHERDQIRIIEEEEWQHRELVGAMLVELNARPDWGREIRALLIGKTLGLLCHFSGWYAPMYGAGKLESRNVGEYEMAALYAAESGCRHFVESLLTMAEVEWDHERFFRTKVEAHWLSRLIPVWKPLPPKSNIRIAFAQI